MPDLPPPRSAFERLVYRIGRQPRLVAARTAAMRLGRVTHALPRPVITRREELAGVLNRRGLLGCAVEIGVREGDFSEQLLRSWRGRHLISVDPWQAAPPGDYVDVANVSQAQHDALYATAVERLREFGARSTVWRMTGEDAAARIPHHCLDFAYIDARHDYASVLEDLGHWFEKVRPGGIFAGHDFLDGRFPDGEFGVRSAVEEFAADHGLSVHATFADLPWPTWWISVPR